MITPLKQFYKLPIDLIGDALINDTIANNVINKEIRNNIIFVIKSTLCSNFVVTLYQIVKSTQNNVSFNIIPTKPEQKESPLLLPKIIPNTVKYIDIDEELPKETLDDYQYQTDIPVIKPLSHMYPVFGDQKGIAKLLPDMDAAHLRKSDVLPAPVWQTGGRLDAENDTILKLIMFELPHVLVRNILPTLVDQPHDTYEPYTLQQIIDLITATLLKNKLIVSFKDDKKTSSTYKQIEEVISIYAKIFEIYIPNMLTYQRNYYNYMANCYKTLSILESMLERLAITKEC